ncbi:hypothetical protein BMS3Abin04_02611 [bacterium BMS3Abin04]|nr:hypothetical protein BMS3Abin04_02611 [bacterium BMS3Abin04]
MISWSLLKNVYLSEIKTDIEKYSDFPTETIKEEDIATLPKPVQRYFRYCGYIGKVKMVNAKIDLENVFLKRAPNNKWMRLNCRQYNSVSKPTRIIYLKNNILGIIPFEARDKCQNGKGNMLIKLLKLFTVADAKGLEMDKSALVTVLSETFIIPTYALQDYIEWEAVDNNNAKATLTYNDIKVSGAFNFNDKGEMVSFYTDDRYFAEKDGAYKKIPWSVIVDNYMEKDGIKFPCEIKVIWHYESSDFEYFKCKISNIEYNIMK